MSGAPQSNPYVGLRPFKTSDSHLFFGRREQITELLESLDRHRFLGVVGSSGCGKSSLIQAGLIPALLGGFLIEDREQWAVAQLTPGDYSPLENLAEALERAIGAGPGEPNGLRQEMQSGGIQSACDTLLERMTPEMNLLLLVDQFEEIFAFRGRGFDGSEESLDVNMRREQFRRQAEAADFVALLLALAQRPDVPIYVVVTMRSDFLGDCDLFYGLPEAMNKGRYLVPRLTRKQLEVAIAGPAKLSGTDIAKPLLDRLLNELGDRFDRLPVLQHALLRTWEQWRKDPAAPAITGEHYKDAGTLEGALALHAGELLDDLAKAEGIGPDDKVKRQELERTVAGVFQSLTDTDAANRQVRRAAGLSRIAEENGLSTDRVRQILKPFRDAGFVYVTQQETAGEREERYLLSHESLIRQWGKLKDWVAEERESRDVYRELVLFAAGEKKGERGLLRNPDLAFKRRWWQRKAPRFEWAKRYLDQEQDFREAKQYLERSRRWEVTRFAIGFTTLVTVLAVLIGTTVWALSQRDEARVQRTRAEGQTTAAKKSAADAKQSAADAEKSAREARDQKKIAEDNLILAKQRETEAKAALKLAGANAEEAKKNLADAVDARKVAEKNLADAKTATALAEQRAFETKVAEVASRLVSGDAPVVRANLWEWTTGPDELREQVLSRMLDSEAAARWFATNSDSAVTALLGLNPRGRIAPVRQIVLNECLNRSSMLNSDTIRSVCRILIRELGGAGAADKEIGAKAMTVIQAAYDTGGAFAPAFTTFGDALSEEDVAKVGRLLLGDTPIFNSYSLPGIDFLITFQGRVAEQQKGAIIEKLASSLEKSPYPWNSYAFSDARMAVFAGMLSREEARRMIAAISGRAATNSSFTLSAETARILSWLAKYLTAAEAVRVGHSVLPNAFTLSQPYIDWDQFLPLRRLSENLPAGVAGPYAEELLVWLRGVARSTTTDLGGQRSSGDSMAMANMLYPLRNSFNRDSVRETATELIKGVTDGQYSTYLRLIYAIGGFPVLLGSDPEVIRKFLTGGSVTIQYATNAPDPMARELNAELRSALLKPGVLFAPNTNSITFFPDWVVHGLEPAELLAFLNSVPRTPEGISFLVRLANALDQDQTVRLLNYVGDQIRTSDLDFARIGGVVLDLSFKVRHLAESDPLHKPDVSSLASYLLGVAQRVEGPQRSTALHALANLGPTAAQSRQIADLVLGKSVAPLNLEDAILLADVVEGLNAEQARRVVEVLAAEKDAYAQIRAMLAMGRLGKYLNSEQKKAVLASLLGGTGGLQDEDAGAIAAMLPELDAGQVESVLAAVRDWLHRGARDTSASLVLTLAKQIGPQQRQELIQLAIDPLSNGSRGYDSLQQLENLWPLWDAMDPSQKEHTFQLLLQAIRRDTSVPYNQRPLSDYARLAAAIPSGPDRLRVALWQRLEGNRPSQIGFAEVVRIIGQLDGRPVSSQQLLDILMWPTLQAWARQEVIALLAENSGTTADKLTRRSRQNDFYGYRPYSNTEPVEVDPWSMSKWAAGQNLNISSPMRPAGYQ